MRCKNANDPSAPPGCLGEPDERFTMRFDDIGERPIYWCAACGPGAHAIDAALAKALRDPGFAKRFEAALDQVEQRGRN